MKTVRENHCSWMSKNVNQIWWNVNVSMWQWWGEITGSHKPTILIPLICPMNKHQLEYTPGQHPACANQGSPWWMPLQQVAVNIKSLVTCLKTISHVRLSEPEINHSCLWPFPALIIPAVLLLEPPACCEGTFLSRCWRKSGVPLVTNPAAAALGGTSEGGNNNRDGGDRL